MDLEEVVPEVVPPSQVHLASGYMVKCSNCGFTSSQAADASSGLPLRSVKRKSDEPQEGTSFFIPGLDPLKMNPKVQVENEITALREAIGNQQQKIQDLYTELEEERDASSSAANEAMSMMLRLQNEKAEVEMEAKQFKRFTEEKLVHDQQEIAMLEDLLYKREQAIHSLTCEVQAYKHRMLSYGFTESEVEGAWDGIEENFGDPSIEFAGYNYPPLKCNLIENPSQFEYEDEDYVDIEKYSFGETPRFQDHLKSLEHRIGQIEATPNPNQLEMNFSSTKSVLKKVIVGHSPRQSRHSRRFSADSSSSILCLSREVASDFDTESSSKYETGFRKMDFIPETEDPSDWKKTDNASDFGDDMSDRVYYTVDHVHNAAPSNNNTPKKGIPEDNMSTPRNPFSRPDDSDPDIKKLYMRLQALEADRESLRQALISMRTDKAQIVLLKEIAQHLYREKTPERQTLVKAPSAVRSFSFISIFKWIFSLIFWRRKAHRSKYTFGISASNVGLLMLLDKGPRMRQWRCLTRAQL